MRKLIPLLFAAAALADAPKPPSTEEALVVDVKSAKFIESTTPNSPKGSQAAIIGVDPNTKGATVYANGPGSYTVIPAKVVHQFVCASGADCLLPTRRGGPTDYNFVK